MYKRLLLITVNYFFAINIFAQSLVATDAGSVISFSIKNFGITVTGTFTGLKGNILFDPAAPANSVFNLSVNTSTVNTGIDARDRHLKKEDYFNVEKFPVITFISTKVSASNKSGIFIVSGNITIKGTTQAINFPFVAKASQSGYLFTGTFKLNRRDFQVGSGSLILSDNLDVSFSVYATNKT
ncbi:YceI family protein [Panacibacter ginsenosidivorans]|uniref:YceI family protein n=1 Tax=Panacibacter ginsenosidivorans TaxID=1813871 RepID=A0A5B8V3D9_9BACT|nr:YceI family protein [Panacibacter ginsenosidivorans]QEC66037.1 YceI family protein [Panacibacter ginsenosidivorans]